jgi:methylglutamate dehydrogenase subunit C
MSSLQPRRLAHGGLVDRDQPLHFKFDGYDFAGFVGDTLASALLAGGQTMFGRSFKYHRPRGVMTAGPEEPNALVELRSGARREPNTKTTTIELYDGLVAQSQNRWPNLKFDALSATSLVAPLLPAGFYYKTFMWPASFWEKLYEPAIRHTAGMGRASGEADPDTYEKSHAFCDVLIIGAGAAGVIAALAAGRAGARVILCENDFRLGGRLLADRVEVGARPGHVWIGEIESELRSLANVAIMTRTAAVALTDGGTYTLLERVCDHLPAPAPHKPRQRLWKIIAKRAILATGAFERPIAFGGNDLPGVMQASAVRTYLNRFAVAPTAHMSVFTTTDDGWTTAADLHRAGVHVDAVIDPRAQVSASVRAFAEQAGAAIYVGAELSGAAGVNVVQRIHVSANGRTTAIATGGVAVSGGWNPDIGLTAHLGQRPIWNEKIASFCCPGPPSGMTIVGAAAGEFTLARALAAGLEAGRTAAGDCGFTSPTLAAPSASDSACELSPFWRVSGPRGRVFVDLQNDVTDSDVALAAREGFRSLEHLKRYTTLGMGTDQGKTSAVLGQAMMATLNGQPMSAVGAPIARAPQFPVSIGALAGRHRGRDFRPTRLTASYEWAKANGATFIETGAWLRAQWFTRAAENDWLQSVSREAHAVRANVGFTDVSTLGKIDIQGPDAAILLDRVYINTFSTLPAGRARYGLMLREDGFVMDDGTTSRLGDEHFLMTTTTLNAAKVMQHLEFCHQVLWPDLDVQMVSVTEQWSQYAIAGPNSRAVLGRVVDNGFDLSDEAFPYMAAGSLTVMGGVPARLFRVSFSGERAFELAVPARAGEALVNALMLAGAPFDITPYGSEALGVLRIEKGHAAGGELNGQTTARDLGLARMMSVRKDYVGRVMAGRAALIDPARPALAGFQPVDPTRRLRAGAHFLPIGAENVSTHDEGHMTSVAFSPALNMWIGLGLIKNGPTRHGERVRAYDPVRGDNIEVEICNPVFFDPEGSRLRG